MEKQKKTEVITLRTTKETKEILNKIAENKKWSLSQLAEEIISKYAKENEE